MIDVNRALQPLNEAERAIALLQNYESSAELAEAVQETNNAVQRTLRSLLRADRGAPDDLRMAALSPTELTPDRLIPTLRQRELISLQLAGMIHELEQASRRAAQGQVRASDADLGLRVVDQLREDVHNYSDRPMRAVAHSAVTTGAIEEAPHVVPESDMRARPYKLVALLAIVIIIGVLVWGLFLRDSRLEKGIAAYNQQQYGEARKLLQEEVDDDVSNTTAAFYLARSLRAEKRYSDAAKTLRRAVEESPQDASLRAEFGNLFMDLNQPAAAARRYQEAVEIEPDNNRNWVSLVRALRAAGDSANAESVLQRAPADARALLEGRR
jgi:tetratricopeptide (TPR) repeat protein